MEPVEVCPICDIAGCRHIRERQAQKIDRIEALTNERDEALAQLAEMQEMRPVFQHVRDRIWNEAIEAAAVIADDEDDAISLYVEDRNTRIAQKTCAIVAKCIRALKKGGE